MSFSSIDEVKKVNENDATMNLPTPPTIHTHPTHPTPPALHTPSSCLPDPVNLASEIRTLLDQLQQQCKDEQLAGEKLAQRLSRPYSDGIRFLQKDEPIPPCPAEIVEMMIQDPNSASLKGMIDAFETILDRSPADVINLKTTACLVCAQLSFVAHYDPYTKVSREEFEGGDRRLDKESLDDLREVYNMMVAISLTKEKEKKEKEKVAGGKNKNELSEYQAISLLLREIVHIMKVNLTKSAPQLF